MRERRTEIRCRRAEDKGRRIVYLVSLEGTDGRTNVEKQGKLQPRVLMETDADGNEVWGVLFSSVAPELRD